MTLAAAYVVLLVIRFPDLIRLLDTSGDLSSAYVLTEAISHGHTGAVVMGTQGAWASLWWGLLTQGLSFHRLLWEISPTLLTLATACLIGWSVRRVATRTAGALTVAIVVSASPTALVSFAGPWLHNTSTASVAILGAFLVWLYQRPHRARVVAASALGMSLVVGVCLASDSLLWVEGLAPFGLTALVFARRDHRRDGLRVVLAVIAGSVAASAATSSIMHSLHYSTVPPPLDVSILQVPRHLGWLVQGLLRIGNGSTLVAHSSLLDPLTAMAALVTVAALGATVRRGALDLTQPATGSERLQLRQLHVVFWSAALACTAVSYVLTVEVAADRYLLVAVLAIAAIVPLMLHQPRGRTAVIAGATLFIGASLAALASTTFGLQNRTTATGQAARIERLVNSKRLGIGYAGYSEAAPLDWISHGRLHIYPITVTSGHTEPMGVAHVAAWYRSLPRTPSYLLLAPGDSALPDRIPPGLPNPQHEYRVGTLTVATFSGDLAAYLHRPHQ